MQRLVFLAWVLVSASSMADEPTPLPPVPDTAVVEVEASDVIFPTYPVLVEPADPVTPINTDPVPVTTVKAEEWFVIESMTEKIVLQSPGDLVAVETVKLVDEDGKQAILKLFGKFSDGTGKVEHRSYGKSPYVYLVTAAKPGKMELILVPIGVTDETKIERRTLTVMGVTPNPPPDPGPTPDPDPTPNPIPGDSNRVLILYESSELSSMPASQSVLITAGRVREYLNRKCNKGPDGVTPEFRIWDKDVDTTNVSQVWKDAVAMPRDKLPWLIVSNGKSGYSGPLPVDEAGLLTKLKQYLGD